MPCFLLVGKHVTRSHTMENMSQNTNHRSRNEIEVNSQILVRTLITPAIKNVYTSFNVNKLILRKKGIVLHCCGDNTSLFSEDSSILCKLNWSWILLHCLFAA